MEVGWVGGRSHTFLQNFDSNWFEIFPVSYGDAHGSTLGHVILLVDKIRLINQKTLSFLCFRFDARVTWVFHLLPVSKKMYRFKPLLKKFLVYLMRSLSISFKKYRCVIRVVTVKLPWKMMQVFTKLIWLFYRRISLDEFSRLIVHALFLLLNFSSMGDT